MGQQQLLLVILVTIVVGIAAVVALTTFSSAAQNTNLDSVRDDLSKISLAAQGFYQKPEILAGGNKTFDGFTFKEIAFAGFIEDGSNDLIITNENGTYEITSAAGPELVVEATPASDSTRTLTATIRAGEFEIAE